MTTTLDEGGNGRCAIPSCGQPTGGLFCEAHRASPSYADGQFVSPPVLRRCDAICEDGQRCSSLSRHSRCLRHRRQRAAFGGDDG